MDQFLHFFSLTLPIFYVITVRSVLGVWILSMYHYTCHDNSYISLLQELWSTVNFL